MIINITFETIRKLIFSTMALILFIFADNIILRFILFFAWLYLLSPELFNQYYESIINPQIKKEYKSFSERMIYERPINSLYFILEGAFGVSIIVIYVVVILGLSSLEIWYSPYNIDYGLCGDITSNLMTIGSFLWLVFWLYLIAKGIQYIALQKSIRNQEL